VLFRIREDAGSNLVPEVSSDSLRGFPQVLQADFAVVIYIRPRPLPFIFIPIRYLLIHILTPLNVAQISKSMGKCDLSPLRFHLICAHDLVTRE
jgi:hypothetical protein